MISKTEFSKLAVKGSALIKAGIEGINSSRLYLPLNAITVNLGSNVRRQDQVYARAERESYQDQFLSAGLIKEIDIKAFYPEGSEEPIFQTFDHTRLTALQYLRGRIKAKGYVRPDVMCLWDDRTEDFWIPVNLVDKTISGDADAEISYQLMSNSGEKIDDISLLLLADRLSRTQHPDAKEGKTYTQAQIAEKFTDAGYPTKRETVSYYLDAARIPDLSAIMLRGELPANVQILKTIGKGAKAILAKEFEVESVGDDLNAFVSSMIATIRVMEEKNIRVTAKNVGIAVENWLIDKGFAEGEKQTTGEVTSFEEGGTPPPADNTNPGVKVKEKTVTAEEELLQFLATASNSTTWGEKTVKVKDAMAFILNHYKAGLGADTYIEDAREVFK